MKPLKMISRAVSLLLSLPIYFYRYCISPMLPASCRFTPTCSEYAMQALEIHGLCKGLLLTLWRLLRCNPLCRFGFDPVPPRGKWVSPERKLSK